MAKHTVKVQYEFTPDWDLVQDQLNGIAIACSGELVGSGAGFGARELEFEFEKKQQAEVAFARMNALLRRQKRDFTIR